MIEPLRVGDEIHGHVGGYLGRDFYGPARVEAIGADWIVLRTAGSPYPATVGDPDGWVAIKAARNCDRLHCCWDSKETP